VPSENLSKLIRPTFLSQEIKGLAAAMFFLKTLKPNTHIVWVALTPETQVLAQKAAQLTHGSVVNKRWLGGTLSNWSIIKRGLLIYKVLSLYHFLIPDGLPRYKRLRRWFKGWQKISKPTVLILFNPENHPNICREAKANSVPIIGFTKNTKSLVDFPIYLNSSSLTSLYTSTNALVKAIQTTL